MKIFMTCRCEGDGPKQSPREDGDCFVAKNAPCNDIIFILCMVLLAACAPASTSTNAANQTPTAVIAGDLATQLPAEQAAEPTPRPAIEPFRFVLPTPGA